MNAPIDDGGPAFPSLVYNGQSGYTPKGGMSVRDYFAAAAMQTLLSREDVNMDEANITKWSFAYASAMLAARKGGAP